MKNKPKLSRFNRRKKSNYKKSLLLLLVLILAIYIYMNVDVISTYLFNN